MNILITGGAGFIGSTLARSYLTQANGPVLVVDKLAYPGCRETIDELSTFKQFEFAQQDICDLPRMSRIITTFRPDRIIHLAAESHVDRSIEQPGDFIESNIVGTYVMLNAALSYWQSLASAQGDKFRFLHVSTDEVYGSLDPDEDPFTETTRYSPNSPYAASKAAADHLARAWHITYGLPLLISNCSNNYGPYQYPEKLIPLCILKAIRGASLPIYGDGAQIRDWLFVDDHVKALKQIIERGRVGEQYNIGGHRECTNLDLVEMLCEILDELCPHNPVVAHRRLITYVRDRPGHDRRYGINTEKLTAELGWQPTTDLEDGLRQTVAWYLRNLPWCERVASGHYAGQRLGLEQTTAPG